MFIVFPEFSEECAKNVMNARIQDTEEQKANVQRNKCRKSLNAISDTQSAKCSTNKERRVLEIFLEYC